MFSYYHTIQTEHTHSGILGHDKLVTILYQARESFLRKFGLSESEIGEHVLLTTSINIEYIGMAFVGDKIVIDLTIIQKDNFHIQWQYAVHNCRDKSSIAKAESTSICYSMHKQRAVRASNLFKSITQEVS